MPTCPICNRELGENDRLFMEFYAPKNWWVLRHTLDASTDLRHGDFSITSEKPWCARANVVVSDPIPFQLRGTDWVSF